MNDQKEVQIIKEEKLKVRKDKEESELNATYSFAQEDHTLGNMLRYVLMKDPEVAFCGYSVPHPSEDVMNVRLQTREINTDKTLNKALTRISKMSDILGDKFREALRKYEEKYE